MLDRVVHALTPLAVIGAATYLLAAGRVDSATAVTMITTAGGVGVLAVAAGKKP